MIEDAASEKGVFHVVSGADLRELLRRVAAGEDPEMVYIEFYVGGERVDEEEDE